MLAALLIISSTSVSQTLPFSQRNIDSLTSALKGTANEDRWPVLWELSYQYVLKDLRTADRYSRECIDLAKRLNDTTLLVKASVVRGSVLRRSEKFDSALMVYLPAIKMGALAGMNKELSILYNSAGITYLEKGNFDEALKNFLESLCIRKAEGDTTGLNIVLANVGLSYYKLKNYKKSLQYNLLCLESKEKLRDTVQLFTLLTNLSLCYSHLHDYSNAQYFLDKAFSVKRTVHESNSDFRASYAQGLIYYGMQNQKKAIEFLEKSYRESLETNDTRGQLDNISLLGSLYISQGQLADATTYLKQGEYLLDGNPSFKLEAANVFKLLAEVHRRNHNFEHEAKYWRMHSRMKDSVYKDQLVENIAKIEADFAEKEHQLKLDAKSKQIQFQGEIIQRQKTTNVLIAVTCVLLIILAFALYKASQQKRSIQLLLDQRVKERMQAVEQSRQELLRLQKARDALTDRMSGEIKAFIASINGLCKVGEADVEDKTAKSYMKKVSNITREMTKTLKLLN